MKLEPKEIVKTCSNHYYTWKNEALNADNVQEMKKFLEKAFFWLELQNNLLILWTVENTLGETPSIRKKVQEAYMNVNKKIADYAESVMKDM